MGFIKLLCEHFRILLKPTLDHYREHIVVIKSRFEHRYDSCHFNVTGGEVSCFYKIGGYRVIWTSVFRYSGLIYVNSMSKKHKTLTLSVELAPTSQLHSTDSPYAYDNNQCERNWPPETTLLLH